MPRERFIEIRSVLKQDKKVHDDVIKAMLTALNVTQQEIAYVMQHMNDMDEDL